MEAVYITDKWHWGFGKRGWDLKFRPTKDTVSVSSIDELNAGSCTINEERMLARIELMKTRGVNAEGDLTCIAESSYGLTGTGILSYKWSVSGAEFKQGTDVSASSVVVQTVDDKSVRFIVGCEVNGKLIVSDEFRHQRWITNKLTPRSDLLPDDKLTPGDITDPIPTR